MQAATEHGIPVPRIEAAGTWRDRPVLLLSWCPGRPIGYELRARPWRAWPLGVLFGRMQARMHAVPAPVVPARLTSSWIAWQDAAPDSLRIALQRRTRHTGSLIHLDYHILNILTNGARVTGVLDWTNAQAGDPRADVARTLTILRLDSTDPSLPSWLGRAIWRVFEQGWRYGYRRSTGMRGDLALFHAWAGAVMERDLASKRNAADLVPIREWTQRWTERAIGKAPLSRRASTASLLLPSDRPIPGRSACETLRMQDRYA